MIQDTRSFRYLEVGDRLVQRGKLKTAAAVYSRFADACVAESCMAHARQCVGEDPVQALRSLATAEKLMGASGEGRRLSAIAYQQLGHREIAERFLRATPQ